MIYELFKILLDDTVYSFYLSLGCSLFVAFLFFILALIWPKISEVARFEKRKFRNFFGKEIRNVTDIYLVTDSFYLRDEIRNLGSCLEGKGITIDSIKNDIDKLSNHPFLKNQPFRKPWGVSGTDFLINYASFKAISYLNAEVSKIYHAMPQIINDAEAHKIWSQGTFICIGSPAANIMSLHIFDQSEQAKMNNEGITILKNNKRHKNYKHEDRPPYNDYAIIYKHHNVYCPGHSLIVCAGLGEWGTSAAAKYLAANWKKMYRRYKGTSFVIVLKVLPKTDDATEVVYESKKERIIEIIRDSKLCNNKDKKAESSKDEKKELDDNMVVIGANGEEKTHTFQASACTEELYEKLIRENGSVTEGVPTNTPAVTGDVVKEDED